MGYDPNPIHLVASLVAASCNSMHHTLETSEWNCFEKLSLAMHPVNPQYDYFGSTFQFQRVTYAFC